MDSLFERIGGTEAIDAAVNLFYEKVLADNRIKPFFEGVDMEAAHRHQKTFLRYAFGGSPSYSGKSLRDTHSHLVKEKGLNDHHFDMVIEHLGATLKELGVSDGLVSEAAAIAESTRNEVLCK